MELRLMKAIVLGEVFKTGITVGVLVFTQLFFNSIGLGGIGFAATLYSLAMIGSHWFNVNSNGGIRFGPETELERRSSQTSTAYLLRTGVSLALTLIGFLFWFVIGVLHGVQTTFSAVRKPDDVIRQMAGNNTVLKILYLCVSHWTLYSFARFWMNLYEVMNAFYQESKVEIGTTTNRRK